MYIRVQLALTGNTSYVLHWTESLIMILGITTFSLQLIETLFIPKSVSTYELSLSTYVMALDITYKKILCT